MSVYVFDFIHSELIQLYQCHKEVNKITQITCEQGNIIRSRTGR